MSDANPNSSDVTGRMIEIGERAAESCRRVQIATDELTAVMKRWLADNPPDAA